MRFGCDMYCNTMPSDAQENCGNAGQSDSENSCPAVIQVLDHASGGEISNKVSIVYPQTGSDYVIFCNDSSMDQIIVLQTDETDNESTSVDIAPESNATAGSSCNTFSEYRLSLVPSAQLNSCYDGQPVVYEFVQETHEGSATCKGDSVPYPNIKFNCEILKDEFTKDKSENLEKCVETFRESDDKCLQDICNVDTINKSARHGECAESINRVKFNSVTENDVKSRDKKQEKYIDNLYDEHRERTKSVSSTASQTELSSHVKFQYEALRCEEDAETPSNGPTYGTENAEINTHSQDVSTRNNVSAKGTVESKLLHDGHERKPVSENLSSCSMVEACSKFICHTDKNVESSLDQTKQEISRCSADHSIKKLCNKVSCQLHHKHLPHEIQIVRSELPPSKAENKEELLGRFLFQQVISPRDSTHKCLLCPEQNFQQPDLERHYLMDHHCTVKFSSAKFNPDVIFIIVPKEITDLQSVATLNRACLYCKRTLATAQAARDHYQAKHGKSVCLIPEPCVTSLRSSFHCSVCHEVSGEISSHFKHMKLKHLDQTYPCTCRFSSKNVQASQHNVQKHLQEHKQSFQNELLDTFFDCEICLILFLDAESLLKSQYQNGNGVNSMSCENYSFSRQNRLEMTTHVENCEESRSNAPIDILTKRNCRCPYCFVFLEDFHKECCSECSQKPYGPSKELDEFIDQKISSKMAKPIKRISILHVCSDCHVSLSSEEQMREHLFKANHASFICTEAVRKFLKCITCSVVFQSEKKFKLHKCIPEASEKNVYECYFCNMEFKFIDLYEKHLLHVHMVWLKQETTVSKEAIAQDGEVKESHDRRIKDGSQSHGALSESSEDTNSAANFNAKNADTNVTDVLELSLEKLDLSTETQLTSDSIEESFLLDKQMDHTCDIYDIDSYNESSIEEYIGEEQSSTKESHTITDIKGSLTMEDIQPLQNLPYIGLPAKDVYVCHICEKTMPNYGIFYMHMQEDHNLEKQFQCVVLSCKYRTSNLQEFQKHSNFHVQNKGHFCYVCDVFFTCNRELEEHLRTAEHGERHIAMHVNSGTTAEPHNYKCEICNSWFGLHMSFIKHKESCSHKYSCPKCKLMFLLPEQRRSHIEQKHPESSKTCEVCGEEFTDSADLWNHLKNHYTLLECKTCHKYFWKYEHFLLHMEMHEPASKCPWVGCSEIFSTKLELNKHFKKHQKGCVCIYCDKGFPSESVLNRHVRDIHRLIPFEKEKGKAKNVKQVLEGAEFIPVSSKENHPEKGLLEGTQCNQTLGEAEYTGQVLLEGKHSSQTSPKALHPDIMSMEEAQTDLLSAEGTTCDETSKEGTDPSQASPKVLSDQPTSHCSRVLRGKTFSTKRELRKKLEKHKTSVMCICCDKSVSSKLEIDKHRRSILRLNTSVKGVANKKLRNPKISKKEAWKLKGRKSNHKKFKKPKVRCQKARYQKSRKQKIRNQKARSAKAKLQKHEVFIGNNGIIQGNSSQVGDFVPCICCEETFCSEEKYKQHLKNHKVKLQNKVGDNSSDEQPKAIVTTTKPREKISAAQAAVEKIMRKYRPILPSSMRNGQYQPMFYICKKKKDKAPCEKPDLQENKPPEEIKAEGEKSETQPQLELPGLVPDVQNPMDSSRSEEKQLESEGSEPVLQSPGLMPEVLNAINKLYSEKKHIQSLGCCAMQCLECNHCIWTPHCDTDNSSDDLSDSDDPELPMPTVFFRGQDLETLQPCTESCFDTWPESCSIYTQISSDGQQENTHTEKSPPVIIHLIPFVDPDLEGTENMKEASCVKPATDVSTNVAVKMGSESLSLGAETNRDPLPVLTTPADTRQDPPKKIECSFLNHTVKKSLPQVVQMECDKSKAGEAESKPSWGCCGVLFSKKEDFREHVECHQGYLHCVYCEKSFSDVEEFRKHKKFHNISSHQPQDAVFAIEREIFRSIRNPVQLLFAGKMELDHSETSSKDIGDSAFSISGSKEEQESNCEKVPLDSNISYLNVSPREASTLVPNENLAITVTCLDSTSVNPTEREVLAKQQLARVSSRPCHITDTKVKPMACKRRIDTQESQNDSDSDEFSPQKKKRTGERPHGKGTNSFETRIQAKSTVLTEGDEKPTDGRKYPKKTTKSRLTIRQILSLLEPEKIESFPVKKETESSDFERKSMFSPGLKIHSIFSLSANSETFFP